MANVSGKFSEVKIARRERHHVCGGNASHAEAVTRYNRAERKAARQALARYADEITVCIPMGEDADAHVSAFEAWERESFYFGSDDFDDRHGCGCGLCLGDNGVISMGAGYSIFMSSGYPCDFGLTPELLGLTAE